MNKNFNFNNFESISLTNILNTSISEMEDAYKEIEQIRNEASLRATRELSNDNCTLDEFNKIIELYEMSCVFLREASEKIEKRKKLKQCVEQYKAISNDISDLNKAIAWAKETGNKPAIRALIADRDGAESALESVYKKIMKYSN